MRNIDPQRIRADGITAGDYSYHNGMQVYFGDGGKTKLRIGKFCSIGNGVTFLLGCEHHPHAVSTFPFYDFDPALRAWADAQPGFRSHGDIVVGNDVWLGLRAAIRSGVTIGDGAVVAAHAVVGEDVPPYAIVGGVPARVIRYRHTPGQIEALRRIAWWDWDIGRIEAARYDLLSTDLDAFIAKYDVR